MAYAKAVVVGGDAEEPKGEAAGQNHSAAAAGHEDPMPYADAVVSGGDDFAGAAADFSGAVSASASHPAGDSQKGKHVAVDGGGRDADRQPPASYAEAVVASEGSNAPTGAEQGAGDGVGTTAAAWKTSQAQDENRRAADAEKEAELGNTPQSTERGMKAVLQERLPNENLTLGPSNASVPTPAEASAGTAAEQPQQGFGKEGRVSHAHSNPGKKGAGISALNGAALFLGACI
jgi:hypothetical protein